MRSESGILGKLFVIAIAGVAVESFGASATNEATSVRSAIEARGPREVARELWQDQARWTTTIRGIRTGNRAWVDVAVALRAGADGGARSELHDAMFQALGENPQYVLQKAAKVYPLEVLCSGRADPLPTYDESLVELTRVRSALEGVKDAHLQSRRNACLATLRSAEKKLADFFERAPN